MIAPADGRPEFAWTSSGDGSFTEGRVRSDWRDLVATDRQVTFMALEGPGRVTVTASLVDLGGLSFTTGGRDFRGSRSSLQCSGRSERGKAYDGPNHCKGTGEPAWRDTGDTV